MDWEIKDLAVISFLIMPALCFMLRVFNLNALFFGARMTAIKHALQRDIFTPNDERLLSIVNVCKAGKKKKNCFLCATGNWWNIAWHQLVKLIKSQIIIWKLCETNFVFGLVTTERPVQVKVVKVKKSDKGDFYKRQMAWELRDLTEVDAKDANKVRTHV